MIAIVIIASYSVRMSIFKFSIVMIASALLAACQQTYSAPPSGEMATRLLTQAEVASSLGKSEEAVSLYRKAIQAAPDAARGYLQLAELYRSMNEQQQALEVLQAGYARAPVSSGVVVEYARQLLFAGNAEAAEAVAQQAYEDHPKNVRLLNVLGVVADRSQP